MITLIIYGVIAIALASAAGYAFMSFSSSSRQLTLLQQNQVQMDTATAALRASLLGLSNNGVAYAPLGYFAAGQAYMQLPATLGVVGASPWGQPYLYCPVSQTGITNETGQTLTANGVQSQSGATYAINTLSNSLTQGNNYVITNDPTNAPPVATGYVAFIVSTLGPGQTMPDCSQIIITAGGISVPGGSVRAVTAGFSFMQRITASSDKMELYVGTTATGDGSGRDVNDLATMDNAMALWSTLQPRLGMIYLENSLTTASTFNAQDYSGTDIRGQNASLIVETDPNIAGGTIVTLALSSNLSLPAATTFQNVNITGPGAIYAYKPLTFRHVTFTGPASSTIMNVYGADLTLNDSSFSSVNLYTTNSHVIFLNDAVVPSTSFSGAIVANNSNIAFESGLPTLSVTYTLRPSATVILSGTASNVTIGAPTGVATTTVNTTGQIALYSGDLVINTKGTLASTTTTSYPLYVTNGSATIAGNFNVTSSSAAIEAIGSSVNVSGALNANTGTKSAILGETAKITGSGTIKVYAATNPCMEFYSTSGALVPIYINAADSTAGGYPGYAPFPNAKYGYPPLLSYTTGTYDTATVAGGLTQSTTSGTDPYITVSGISGVVGSTMSSNGYADKPSFEAGVRSIVNQEFRPGLDMYFTGTCGP